MAFPDIEAGLPLLATPDALLGVEAEAVPTLESQIPLLTTPEVLLGLKDEIEENPLILINCTTSAVVLNQTIYVAAALIFGTLQGSLEYFFNDPSWTVNTGKLMPINVISEVMTGGLANLSFTPAAQQTIMIESISILNVADFPGLINDTALGIGVGRFLELYLATFDPTTSPMINATIQALYNATWSQLSAVAGYMKNYLFPLVPGFFFL